MEVRIFKPAKTAMQSGRSKTHAWVLEFEPQNAARPDPLMGWSGSADTSKQVRVSFNSKEDAIAYAVKNGHSYTIQEERVRKIKPKAYADNFAFNRIAPWTH